MSAEGAVASGGAELGRRTIIMLLVALVVGAPAVLLRLTCIGHACDEPSKATATIPFCSLPGELRARVATGFRDGRSPDVFGVTGSVPVAGGTAAPGVPWPSTENTADPRVPLVFAGDGIEGSTELPPRPTLDSVAPTIAAIVALDRPHPEVRSGEALPVTATGASPRLVLEVVWKGVGSREIDEAATPNLEELMDEGIGTMDAGSASAPPDPAAILTTIGTGGVPSQHGITGTLVRNDDGELVRAWSKDAPLSVIAGLGDDLDEYNEGRPLIGLVEDRPEDRGLVGGNWYLGRENDDDIVRTKDAAAGARRLLASGYGLDDEADLLAVTFSGKVEQMDRTLGRLITAAESASGGRLLIVLTATGSREFDRTAIPGSEIAAELDAAIGAPVTEAVAPGGIYLNQEVLTRKAITEKQITDALLAARATDGSRLLADAFPAITISFLRYC